MYLRQMIPDVQIELLLTEEKRKARAVFVVISSQATQYNYLTIRH